uniref:Uncharacterized protein n=1 Tax=Knipowitschia caucasica TaxID=637954 RepID=A0AAV2LGX3_KNICA
MELDKPATSLLAREVDRRAHKRRDILVFGLLLRLGIVSPVTGVGRCHSGPLRSSETDPFPVILCGICLSVSEASLSNRRAFHSQSGPSRNGFRYAIIHALRGALAWSIPGSGDRWGHGAIAVILI